MIVLTTGAEMNAIVIPAATDIQRAGLIDQDYERLVDRTLKSVSASSARVYMDTFRQWAAWADSKGIHPLDISYDHAADFLGDRAASKTSGQRMLSALRKLAQMAFIMTGDDLAKRMYEMLKVLRVPGELKQATGIERTKRALPPSDADRVLRAWQAAPARPADQPRYLRNAALVAVLILSGLRRSEAAALCWTDIDFEHGVISVRHGKGDKARQAALASDTALDLLRAWQMAQPSGFLHIFTPCGRGQHLPADRPITGGEVYKVIKATETMTGIEFRPHDMRRTWITEALYTGADLKTVQALAGHARPETTLGYAQAVDARRARGELRFRFG